MSNKDKQIYQLDTFFPIKLWNKINDQKLLSKIFTSTLFFPALMKAFPAPLDSIRVQKGKAKMAIMLILHWRKFHRPFFALI